MKIEFQTDHRCFKKGDTFTFGPGKVNFLVGDQGTGKSTLLDLMSGRKNREVVKITLPDSHKKIVHRDFEHDNSRTAAAFGGLGDMGIEVAMIFASHGQAVSLSLRELIDSLKEPSIILLDEPDTGLSVKTIRLLMIVFDHIVAKGHILILAVHNPLLYMSAKERTVFDMEKRTWVPGKEFFDRMMSEPLFPQKAKK